MRNRVKNLLNKILINAGDENGRVVIFDPNFEAEINFRSVFFNKTHGVSNATGNTLIPVLNIPDFELFVDSMTDYLTEAIPFYKNDFLGLEPRYLAEKLIYDVLGSATPADFANMVPYLKHRTNMLKNKFKKQIFHWGNPARRGVRAIWLRSDRWSGRRCAAGNFPAGLHPGNDRSGTRRRRLP